MFDVLIIGAGVVGSAIAREISRFKMRTIVLEKESDVCCGTSKANSAIIHAGFDAKPGTIKGQLNAIANKMFDELSEELDFPFVRNGSLVLCFDKKDLPKLNELFERGVANGVPDLKIIDGDTVREMEPRISGRVVAALYAPTGGIVCPFGLNIAMAENANTNGVEFRFNSPVEKVKRNEDGTYKVITDKEEFLSKTVINAAGLYSDVINNMVSSDTFVVTPRRGEYNLLDKEEGNMVSKTIFQLPTEYGKGVLVSPTIHGNLIIGPNAIDQYLKNDLDTRKDGLDDIMQKASLSIEGIPARKVITSFAGLRARTDRDDFIIGEASDAPGFINAAGIESPGLTCSPLIGKLVAEIIEKKLTPELNPDFNPRRKGVVHFSSLSEEERKKIAKDNPHYGRIVCRCESVTEGEIIDAINRPLGARDIDGIKRRTRAGMGRCQGGFCLVRNMELLKDYLHEDFCSITKSAENSTYVTGKNKEWL